MNVNQIAVPFFLDTNIFVYSFDSRSPAKRRIAIELIRYALESQTGIISTQVVQEFLNVATGKLAVAFQARDAKDYLAQVLAPLCQVFATFEVYDRAISIRELYGLSFYDSLIVCGALQARCKTLVTEDLQPGQRFESLIVLNPFQTPK
jgi:predicted nucleic acid-binding protein